MVVMERGHIGDFNFEIAGQKSYNTWIINYDVEPRVCYIENLVTGSTYEKLRKFRASNPIQEQNSCSAHDITLKRMHK